MADSTQRRTAAANADLWAGLMAHVAPALLGEPNSRLSHPSAGELRYGTRGSLVVHVPPHRADTCIVRTRGPGCRHSVGKLPSCSPTPDTAMRAWFLDGPGPLAGAHGHDPAPALGTPAGGVGIRLNLPRRHRRGTFHQVVRLVHEPIRRCVHVPPLWMMVSSRQLHVAPALADHTVW